ncbi:MAG: hypothetical protein ACODAC_04185 [Pseudomonadota bacterium]
MGKRWIVGVLVVATAGALALWFRAGAGGGAPEPAAADPEPAVAASEAPASPQPEEPAAEPESTPAATEAPLPEGMTPEEARRERRLLELREAAEARFSETVELDGLRASDARPEVRRLFEAVTLEPVFDVQQATEGYVSGMRIAEMTSRNALARAGFRTGDRLTRIDGQPLVDPAQIAYTMVSLGEAFEVCAERDTAAYCRTVTLDDG